MIDVHTWPTPNGHKVHIMLEECGLKRDRDWRALPVNIGTGDQFKPEFLKISPNNKIPALIDPNGPDGKPISLFESGATYTYRCSGHFKFVVIAIAPPDQSGDDTYSAFKQSQNSILFGLYFVIVELLHVELRTLLQGHTTFIPKRHYRVRLIPGYQRISLIYCRT